MLSYHQVTRFFPEIFVLCFAAANAKQEVTRNSLILVRVGHRVEGSVCGNCGRSALVYAEVNVPSLGTCAAVIGIDPEFDAAAISSLTIPAKVNCMTVSMLADGAFAGYTLLVSVTLPDSIQSIEGTAFRGCAALENIVLSNTNPYFTVVNGSLYNKDVTALVLYLGDGSAFTFPYSVTAIGNNAFVCGKDLIDIRLTGVIMIGENAFSGRFRLRVIMLSDCLRSIGADAFEGCDSLDQFCYEGTSEQWQNVSLGEGVSGAIPSEKLYYYSEDQNL